MRPLRIPSAMRWQNKAGMRSCETPMKEAISCLNVMLHKWTAEMHPSKLAADACFVAACEDPHVIKVNAVATRREILLFTVETPASRWELNWSGGKVKR